MTADQPRWGPDRIGIERPPGDSERPVRLEVFGPEPESRRGQARHAVVLLATVLVIGVLGIGAGWLWSVVAPRVPIIKADSGYLYADAEPEQAIAADGWFLIIGVVLGVLIGVTAWVVLRHYRGVSVLASLIVGSLIGAWVAWWVGYRIGREQFLAATAHAPIGSHLKAPLELGMTNMDPHRWWFPGLTGVIVSQALAAAVAYTVPAGFSAYENLRGARVQPGDDPSGG